MADKPEKPEKLPLPKPRVGGLSRLFLDLDARIGHALFAANILFRAKWEDWSGFMDRFHVTGLKRLAVEAASEGLTLGAAGAIVMLALAVPAFRETTDENWLKKSGARGHLSRPLRQRDRRARHPPQRHGAARGIARPSDQGGAGHRGPALLTSISASISSAPCARSAPTCAPRTSCRAARRSRSSWRRTCF